MCEVFTVFFAALRPNAPSINQILAAARPWNNRGRAFFVPRWEKDHRKKVGHSLGHSREAKKPQTLENKDGARCRVRTCEKKPPLVNMRKTLFLKAFETAKTCKNSKTRTQFRSQSPPHLTYGIHLQARRMQYMAGAVLCH